MINGEQNEVVTWFILEHYGTNAIFKNIKHLKIHNSTFLLAAADVFSIIDHMMKDQIVMFGSRRTLDSLGMMHCLFINYHHA